jgi:hypothetical protein
LTKARAAHIVPAFEPRFVSGANLTHAPVSRTILTSRKTKENTPMPTRKAAKKGTKKSGAAKKSSAAKKSGGTKKSAAKKSAAKKGTATGAGATAGNCTGWQAVEDSMPPGPSRLRVTGKCLFPTHGYKVTLKEAVPQGINPRILLLRKTVTPPTGPVILTPQTIEVTFNKKTLTQYTNVTILPDGGTIKVKHVV